MSLAATVREDHGKEGTPDDSKTRFVCDTMDAHRRLAHLDPEYRRRRREIELETREFIAQYAEEDLFTGVVRIPVVVHVVWNTAVQNVSDAQINSQITALNEVFRLTNADAVNIPTGFAGVAADTRIEFALAVRDPNCGTTNGITRTNTATASFSAATLENVKSAATGGADPWPSDRYLNIWVCNISGSLKGRAHLPRRTRRARWICGRLRLFRGRRHARWRPSIWAASPPMNSATG